MEVERRKLETDGNVKLMEWDYLVINECSS